MQLKKIKYLVATLPLGFSLVAIATVAQSASSPKISQVRRATIETIETTVAPADVTIDGEHVVLPSDGIATIKKGNTQATVQSSQTVTESRPQQTTSVTQDGDGGQVNISVNTSNGNRSSYSSTSVSSYSSNRSGSSTSSSVQVMTSGVGRVTVTK